MAHLSEASGRQDKTISDYVFAYMRYGHQCDEVPRQKWETDLHYAGTDAVPLCWHFWHTYRIEDLVSNVLMAHRLRSLTRIGRPE